MQNKIYVVSFKGIGIGMTFDKAEAVSWCNGPGYTIQERSYRK